MRSVRALFLLLAATSALQLRPSPSQPRPLGPHRSGRPRVAAIRLEADDDGDGDGGPPPGPASLLDGLFSSPVFLPLAFAVGFFFSPGAPQAPPAVDGLPGLPSAAQMQRDERRIISESTTSELYSKSQVGEQLPSRRQMLRDERSIISESTASELYGR